MEKKLPITSLSREEKLLGGLDIENSRGIEIGPLGKPLIKKPQADVRYVDHLDQAGLRLKYAHDPNVSAEDIVAIDAVWGDKTLSECFSGEQFDYAIASHVMEHVPDLAGWLAEIASVLKDDGRLILAVPDKRYTFDVLRRETPLSEVVDNYLRHVRRPTPGQVFDYSANAVDFDHIAAWYPTDPAKELVHFMTPSIALSEAKRSRDGQYVDGHCTVFTARSLLNLLDGLAELRLLPFRLERFHVAAVGSGEIDLVLLRQADNADCQAARERFQQILSTGLDSEGLPID